MQVFLKENQSKVDALKRPTPRKIFVPYNAGRRVGIKGRIQRQDGGFSTVPGPDRVSLTDWINYVAAAGDLTAIVTTTLNQTIAGNKTFTGTTTLSGANTLSGATTVSGATTLSNAVVNAVNLPTYADNAAAVSGGIADGDLYQTATGEVRIKYTP